MKWRKLTFESEIKVIEAFLNEVKENPEKFIEKYDVKLKLLSEKKSTFYVNLELPVVVDHEKRSFPVRNSRSSLKRSSLFFRGLKYSQPLKECRFLNELEQKLAHKKDDKCENITATNEQEDIVANSEIIKSHQNEESKLQENVKNRETLNNPQQDHIDKSNDAIGTQYLVPISEKYRSKLIGTYRFKTYRPIFLHRTLQNPNII